MKKMRIMSNILGIMASLYSMYLVVTLDLGLYGSLIKLSVIPVIFLPQIIEQILHVKMNSYVSFVYTIFIFLAHFLGSVVDFYHKIYWYDSFAHFLSGVLVAFLATYALKLFKKYSKDSLLFNILFILGMSFMVAGLWEMFEFTSDKIFGKDAQNVLTTGVNDTMKDMIVAFLGTALYILLYIYEEVNNKKIIIRKFIETI